MFTGIIRQKGRVVGVQSTPHGVRLAIAAGPPLDGNAGESVSVNGCCLTLLNEAPGGRLEFDVVPETLRCTTLGALRSGDEVNLEPAVTAATMLSGHIVQGHVDGVGSAVRHDDGQGGEMTLRVGTPAMLMCYIMPKGSIAVDGVSLTVAQVGDDWFDVALIPATLEQTSLSRIGSAPMPVNLEVDYLARIVVTYLRRLPGSSRG